MATGRTTTRWMRAYLDGYNLSGYARNIGPLQWLWDEIIVAGLDWPIKSAMLNKPTIGVGVLNAYLDDTATTGSHVIGDAGNGSAHKVMVPVGILDVPAQGDPVFCGIFQQSGYQAETSEGVITLNMQFGGWDQNSLINYGRPWGQLLHALSNVTAVNAATGVDGGASSTAGGWMMYQIQSITGTGTVTITVQDSADNSTGWANVTNLTSGAIATASAPTAGIAQAVTTATIKRYTRWQIAFSGATGCTFALAFVRGNGL